MYTTVVVSIELSRLQWLMFVCTIITLICISSACAPNTTANTSSSVLETQTGSPQEKPILTIVEGTVTDVIDNNIISVNIGGIEYNVRYIGIYTLVPYLHNKSIKYYADEGYKKNFELVNGKVVRLEKDISDTDKSGYLLRYVWVDGVMVNAELVSQGYAMVLGSPPDIKYLDNLIKLQQEAQEQGRGLWVEETGTDGNAPLLTTFVGDRISKIYHYSSCDLVQYIKEDRRISFISANSALALGYRPCKVCKCPENACSSEPVEISPIPELP